MIFIFLALFSVLATDVKYSIILTVSENQHYRVGGVSYMINYDGSPLLHGISDALGNIQGQGTFKQMASYLITVTALTAQSIYSQQSQFAGQLVDNVVQFKGDIYFDQNDVEATSLIVRGDLKTNIVDRKSNVVEGALMEYTVNYQYKNQNEKLVFTGLSDKSGIIPANVLMPRVLAAMVLYKLSKYECWNAFDTNTENPQHILLSKSMYKVEINAVLDTSTIDLTITGSIVDKKTSKPISGAIIDIKMQEQDKLANLPDLSLNTDAQGLLKQTVKIKVYSQINFVYVIKKDKYGEYTDTTTLKIDKDKPVQTLTVDLKQIQLVEAPGQLIFTGHISDKTEVIKFVASARLSLTVTDIKEILIANTDADGKFELKVFVPVHETLQLKGTIDRDDFISQTIDTIAFSVTDSAIPYTITKDFLLDRVRKDITIKDKLLNGTTTQPLGNAQVSIISSLPTIQNFKYGVVVADQADGTFTLPFQCYQNVQFQASLNVQVPSYSPYKFTTEKEKCENVVIPSTNVILSKVTSNLIINFKALGPDGKGVPNLSIDVKSDNPIDGLPTTITTDASGLQKVQNLKVIPKYEYTFTASYKNALGEVQSQQQKYTPNEEPNQTLDFAPIYIQQFVKAQVSGTINSPTGKVGVPIPLTATTDAKGKDGKPITIQTTTKPDGSYSFNFEPLAQGDKPITVTVKSGDTTSVTPITQTVVLKPPNYTAEQNIPVTLVLYDVIIKGQVQDGQHIMTNGVEGANIELVVGPIEAIVITNTKRILRRINNHYVFHLVDTSIKATSDKAGQYNIAFKIIAGQNINSEIKVNHPQFQPFTTKIVIPNNKNDNIVQDIVLQRVLLLVKLHSFVYDSTKKPIPNTGISIISSDPTVKDSKFYNVITKDDDKGSFNLDFQCYQNLDIILQLEFSVPTFVSQKQNSNKFTCSQPTQELTPFTLSLEKIVVLTTFSGIFKTPLNKPESGVSWQLNTNPATIPLTGTTGADGKWSAADNKIIPNTDYEATFSYVNILKKNVEVKKKFNVQNAGQAVDFGETFYQDYVTAKVSGQVAAEKGSITQPVTMNINCPNQVDAKGPINQDFKTDNTGKFSVTINPLASYDQTINCVVSTKDVVEPSQSPVQLTGAKNFESNDVSIKSKLQSSQIQIDGQLSDATKIANTVGGTKISLALKPTDPLLTADPLVVTTDPAGKYSFKFLAVKGVQYDGTISVDASPQFQAQSIPIKIDASKDQTISKDMALQRVIIPFTLTSSLQDSQKKPITNANVQIDSSDPPMPDKALYDKPVQAPTGKFSIPFECYNTVQTNVVLEMTSEQYKKQTLPTQSFKCGEKEITLPPIVVTFKSVQLTIQGLISDLTGVVKGVQNVVVEIQFTPPDPLATSFITQTDSTGAYKIVFPAIQDQQYNIIAKFTNQDFKPTQGEAKITADKDQQVIINSSMDRIIVQATISGTFQGKDGKPIPNPSVTVTSLEPRVKGDTSGKTPVQGDANGNFKESIPCYSGQTESIQFKVESKDYETIDTPKSTFTCGQPNVTIPPQKLPTEPKPTTTSLSIGGKVLNPEGKGQGKVDILLDSEPATKQLSTTTKDDGSWSISDNQLLMKTKYKLTASYKDVDGKIQKVNQDFQSDQATSNLKFPDINYAAYEKASIKGQAQMNNALPVKLQQIAIDCDTLGKDKKPYSSSAYTDVQGQFAFNFEFLAQLSVDHICKISSKASDKYKAFEQKVEIKPPVFEYQVQLGLQPTPQFEDQLKKYYIMINIRGQVFGSFSCNGQIVSKTIQGVKAELLQWDGIDYQPLNVSVLTDAQGIYNLPYYILKSQMQNEIRVLLSKKDFIDNYFNINPFSYYVQGQDKISFNVGIQTLQHINGVAPCEQIILFNSDFVQQKHKITNKRQIIVMLQDQFQNPIQGAQIRLLENEKFLKKTLSNENGLFSFKYEHKQEQYILQFFFIKIRKSYKLRIFAENHKTTDYLILTNERAYVIQLQ